MSRRGLAADEVAHSHWLVSADDGPAASGISIAAPWRLTPVAASRSDAAGVLPSAGARPRSCRLRLASAEKM